MSQLIINTETLLLRGVHTFQFSLVLTKCPVFCPRIPPSLHTTFGCHLSQLRPPKKLSQSGGLRADIHLSQYWRLEVPGQSPTGWVLVRILPLAGPVSSHAEQSKPPGVASPAGTSRTGSGPGLMPSSNLSHFHRGLLSERSHTGD